MPGKPSADDLHHGSEIAFANVLWDIVRVWEQLRIAAPGVFPESGPELSPLLFYRTSLSCEYELKRIAGTEATELGEVAYLYDTGCLTAQSEVGGSALLRESGR